MNPSSALAAVLAIAAMPDLGQHIDNRKARRAAKARKRRAARKARKGR